jgi:hypothetical protein
LRELLFPVHETAGAIANIKAGLAAADLNFVGFNDMPYGEYAKRFPDDRAMTDFGNWEAVENDNPAVFGAIYQFWVQKPAEAELAPA